MNLLVNDPEDSRIAADDNDAWDYKSCHEQGRLRAAPVRVGQN